MSQFSTFCRLAVQTQMLPILESGEETLVGGQAVMEGVMMRAPHSYCVAVRKANGELVTEEASIAKISEKYPIFKYPVLRGLGTLGQAMSLGMKALQFSTNAALGDEAEKTGEKPVQLSSWMMGVNIAISLAFFIVLYKLVPLMIVEQIGKWSMMDVMLLALLVMMIKLSGVVQFHSGPALIAFVLCVSMSMISAICFDPHAIWETP